VNQLGEGELQKRIKKEHFYCDECEAYKVYEDDVFKQIDEAKKDCPMLKLIDGYEKYGDEFPTKEVMDKRRLELLIETYKWLKKWFGELQQTT